jgi:hypothetical protein
MAHRDLQHLDRPPSLSGHCGHGPLTSSAAGEPAYDVTAEPQDGKLTGLNGRTDLR